MPFAVPAPLTQAEQVLAAGADPLYLPVMLRHRQLVLAEGIPFRLESVRRSSDHQAQLNAQREAAHAAWVRGGRVGPEPRPAAKVSKHELGMAHDFSGPRNAQEWARAGELAELVGLESGHRYRQPDPGHAELPDAIDHLKTAVGLRLGATIAALGLAYMVTK